MDRPYEIVFLSGKGGTGKTTIAAAFASLSENAVITDCDVDASDLHLILSPELYKSENFDSGS
ncbi:MAG: ArsA-related P-loop ATPase, partial [Bacteroidales bacterium]